MDRFGKEGEIQQNSGFQSNFSVSNISRILQNFFSSKNMKIGEQILLLTYFDNCMYFITKNGPEF